MPPRKKYFFSSQEKNIFSCSLAIKKKKERKRKSFAVNGRDSSMARTRRLNQQLVGSIMNIIFLLN